MEREKFIGWRSSKEFNSCIWKFNGTQGPSSWKIPEYTWTGQSLGIHLALQVTQASYLTGKVDSVPHHDGVVGEDGRGEVGSGVQSLGIHLDFEAA